MPMNARLLRPTSSTLDADAAVYLNAVAQADGQQLEPAVRKAINDFVVGCKRDGIWDAIKASCILAGARTISGALTPLKGTAPTPYNFAEADYSRETGLVGNGTDTYLDSNRANDADPQDDWHFSLYYTSVNPAAGKLEAGAGGTANGALNFAQAATNLFLRSKSTSSGESVATSGHTGFAGVSRGLSTEYAYRINASTGSQSTTSATPTADNVFVFARNDGAGSSQFPTDARLAFYSIGESVDLAALDARVSALITAIGNAI